MNQNSDASIHERFLEIETKYDADNIERLEFKALMKSLAPSSFLYVESADKYFVKSETEFLRFRMPPGNGDQRSELTFKKKHGTLNNNVRTEVNLRVDLNRPELVDKFCEGLGYSFNFSIYKLCDIYYFEDANVVLYAVIDENNKVRSFLEIEVKEDQDITEDAAWDIILKYEKLLSPLGINAQKRKKLSLYEMYKKEVA